MSTKQPVCAKNIVGIWIGEFRRRNNLSLTQMADYLNARNITWDSNTVYKAERGARKITDIEVRNLAEALDMPLETLLSINSEELAAHVTLEDIMNLDKVKIGARLRKSREYIGYSLEKVSEVCGTNINYMESLEAGRKTISLQLCMKLCKLYNCTPNYLLLEKTEKGDYSEKMSALSQRERDAVMNIIDVIQESR